MLRTTVQDRHVAGGFVKKLYILYNTERDRHVAGGFKNDFDHAWIALIHASACNSNQNSHSGVYEVDLW